MNEPSNFVKGSSTGCANNMYNNPPLTPLEDAAITDKTLCMDSLQVPTGVCHRMGSERSCGRLGGGTTLCTRFTVTRSQSQRAPPSSRCSPTTGLSSCPGQSPSSSRLRRPKVDNGSRSTYIGSGAWAFHWTGDDTSKWDQLKFSIITILEFQVCWCIPKRTLCRR